MKISNSYLELWILCSYADSRLFFFTAIFGFLLATLAVTSFGAPVERSIWNHSCGYAMKAESNTGILGVRHGAAKQINVVGNQIAIAISHVNTKRKIINKFYNAVSFRLKSTEMAHNSKWKPVVNLQ